MSNRQAGRGTAAAPAAAAAPRARRGGAQPVFVAPGDTRVPHTSSARSSRGACSSPSDVPHFYLTVNRDRCVLAARQRSTRGGEEGTKVSVNDMVIKAWP